MEIAEATRTRLTRRGLRRLQSRWPWQRRRGTASLAVAGGQDAKSALLAALDDPDPRVRFAAFVSLPMLEEWRPSPAEIVRAVSDEAGGDRDASLILTKYLMETGVDWWGPLSTLGLLDLVREAQASGPEEVRRWATEVLAHEGELG